MNHTVIRVLRLWTHSLAVLVTIVAISACDGDSSSSSTSTPTSATSTPAEPAITEEFSGTLAVKGTNWYPFVVAAYGTVNVQLASIGGHLVPSTVMVSLGQGVQSEDDCSVSAPTTTTASSAPQVTAVLDAGTYCVKISDVGNLFAPATFSITVAHP